MHEDLAIIMAGGGMRSAYAVGVMLALAEEYDVREPGILIAGSGSAGTAAYYLAGQYESIRNIWTELLASKRFINPWRFWKIIDIGYLVDVVFRKLDPLCESYVSQSRSLFLIPALDKRTGRVIYFTNENGNLFELLRATKALPVAFRLNPCVRVEDKSCCDSPLSARAEQHISVAIEKGAKRLLMIRSTHPRSLVGWSGRFIFLLWIRFQKGGWEYLHSWRNKRSCEVIPEGIASYTIYPKKRVKVGLLGNRKDGLRAAVEQGYRETVENDELRKFLKSSV